MAQALVRTAEAKPFVIKFKPLAYMDDEQFTKFCALNDILRIERTAKGEIILMPPTHGITGHRNAKNQCMRLAIWSRADGTGLAFG